MGTSADEVKDRQEPIAAPGVEPGAEIKTAARRERQEKMEQMKTMDSKALERQIDATRAELDDTLIALQNKLKLQNISGRVVDSLKDAVRGGAPKVIEAMRNNPMPTAMIAAGVGWMIMRGSNPQIGGRPGTYPGHGYSAVGEAGERIRDKTGQAVESVRDTARQVGEKTSEFASDIQERTGAIAGQAWEKTGQIALQAKEKTGQLASQAAEQVSQLGDKAAEQAGRARDAFARSFQENPLAIGALALAVGAAVGLLLPETRRENEMMGEKRDQLLEKAKVTGAEVAQRVEHVVDQTMESAKEETKSQLGEQPSAAPGG